MKKQNVLRLLSLFVLMFTMSGPAQSSDLINWLRNFFNSYYNDPKNGQLCFSHVNAQTGIGEGKVYVEWAREGTDYNESYANEKLVTEISVQSPEDDTAKKARSASNATHKYVFCAKGDEGWDLENLYSDADFQTKYTPTGGSQTTEDGFYAGKVNLTTSATDIANQPVLNLYVRFALNVTINKRGYSTLYYSKYNFKVPNGVEATTYVLSSDKKQLVESRRYRAGGVIPAGEAVVLEGAANTTYKFIPVKGNYTPDGANVLRGTDEPAMTTGGDEYFVLSWNNNKQKVGFYWMNTDGSAFENGAHKAYLPLGGASGVKGFDLNGDDATGISDVDANVTDGVIYNLAGQRVDKMQKGINIVNGKKILKR